MCKCDRLLKVYIGCRKVFKRNNDVKKDHYLVASVVFYLVDRDQFRAKVEKRKAKETTKSIDDKHLK